MWYEIYYYPVERVKANLVHVLFFPSEKELKTWVRKNLIYKQGDRLRGIICRHIYRLNENGEKTYLGIPGFLGETYSSLLEEIREDASFMKNAIEQERRDYIFYLSREIVRE